MAPLKRLLNRENSRRRFAVVVALVVGSWYAVPRAITTIRFAGDAHIPTLSGDYSGFSAMLPVQNLQISKLHLGLPHNYSERNAFLRSVWLTPTRSFFGYRFQSKVWEASENFRTIAQGIFTDPEAFRPYIGPKLCGGFHADFLARYEDGSEQFTFMVCFGCHEILVFTPSGRRIVELNDWAYAKLSAAWQAEQIR